MAQVATLGTIWEPATGADPLQHLAAACGEVRNAERSDFGVFLRNPRVAAEKSDEFAPVFTDTDDPDPKNLPYTAYAPSQLSCPLIPSL